MSTSRDRFTGGARLLRGLALGSAVLLITIVGHTAGYGGTPDIAPFLLLLPLAVALGAALAERRFSAAGLVGFVVGAQTLMHVVLTVGFSHGAHMGGPSLIPSSRMLLGHAVASVLVLLVLIYGEDLLHRWLRFLADVVREWPLRLDPMLDGATASWARSDQPLLARECAASMRRRGPPAAA